MERLLVTLLLVVIAVTAIVGIESWFDNHRDKLIDKSNATIINAMS